MTDYEITPEDFEYLDARIVGLELATEEILKRLEELEKKING